MSEVIFYKVAILNSPLEPLVYSFEENIEVGTQLHVKLRNRVQKGVVLSVCTKPSFKVSHVDEVLEFYYDKKQLQLAKFIASYYICSLGDALGVMTPFSSSFTTSTVMYSNNIDILLSNKQLDAFRFLQQHKTSLLFGDTGSGKTEIYMSFFEQILKEEKRVLFLMPEISLTPQMEIRLKEHFGDKVVMWHSKLTPLQKRKNLEKIYDGTAYIVAGARSALFLPIKDLGLIVVDEEHDDSYKSNKRPRYNAKDLAIYVGSIHNIHVVLGSATPSLNSYVKFPHVRVRGKHFDSEKTFYYEKSAESITPFIEQNIKDTLKNGMQSIVFLPTRANFKYLVCGDCGENYKCVFCSIGMSVHQKTNSMQCHYCNYTQPIPKVCPSCGSENLVSSRLGTAEVVKTLSEVCSNATIQQFDRDVITTQTKLKKVLKSFNNKEIDILVGTQMLSKGHDYHNVVLAVVLGLDNMLGMSDYRAREKALSTLVQVSGRSGRLKDAKVLVQTFNEEFFSHYMKDYQLFLEDEKLFRVSLYPPYKKLARVLFAHKNGIKAYESMFEMLEKLKRFEDVEIVGSGKCPIERVANKFRFEILLRADKSTSLIKAILYSKNSLAEIDMDAIEFF